MRLIVNGRETEAPGDGLTVAQLLEAEGVAARGCAVEVNREIVPRREHESRRLREGDRVEIVTLVGGG